jgi:uncharacterized protein (DUF58 family)
MLNQVDMIGQTRRKEDLRAAGEAQLTGRDLTLSGDDTLSKRRPWYVLAVLLLIFSILAHQAIAFLAALFALVIGVVPEIWYRYALRNLVFRQQISQPRAFFGETVTLSITVENQKILPLPWLEVEDEIPEYLSLLTGRATQMYKINRMLLAHTFSLWAFQRVTRRYRLGCTRRGVHGFGPITLRSGDPFGWLVREAQLNARTMLLVYPLVAPLEKFGLPSRHPFGDYTTPRRLIEDPLRVAGVREYVRGDDPRRIHWKATARMGELQSKVYEPSSQHRLLILLDINSYPEAWMGVDYEIQELTISAAASLALWALDEGYSVGLLANSLLAGLDSQKAAEGDEIKIAQGTTLSSLSFMHRTRIPMASDSAQRERILSALGRLLAYFGSPIDGLIELEQATLPIGTTVVLLSAATALSEATVERLIEMRRHGCAVHLTLTGDKSGKVGAETYDLPVHHLGGREVWHELVKYAGDAESAGDDQHAPLLVLG